MLRSYDYSCQECHRIYYVRGRFLVWMFCYFFFSWCCMYLRSTKIVDLNKGLTLYSDILISRFRQRQQYTKCTPTCIISTASLFGDKSVPTSII